MILSALPSRPFKTARTWKLIASAGCGKTWHIERTIDELLADGVKPEEIMYILFNKKPADSFVTKYLLKGLERPAMRWWGTHHAICKKMLKLKTEKILDLPEWGAAHGFLLSTRASRMEDEESLGWDAEMQSLERKIFEARQDFSKAELRLLEALKKTEVEEEKYCHTRYMERALRAGLFPPNVRFLFVDEAQDNGRLQFDWISFIAPHLEGLLVAGDDKQAINKFKGGNANLFLDFKTEQTVNLPTTYRLPPRILKQANEIIAPVKKRSATTVSSACGIPGKIISTPFLSDLTLDLFRWLKQGKSVLLLSRNNCWLRYAYQFLLEMDIPFEQEWTLTMKLILAALQEIRVTRWLTESLVAAILPDFKEKRFGQLKTTAYWPKDHVRKLKRGEFADDPTLLAGYEMLRYEGIPLEKAEDIGFSPDFKLDIDRWNIPENKWRLSPDSLVTFRNSVKRYGPNFPTIRLSTIHAAKGEEADVVILLSNISTRVKNEEELDEDGERRVWYVGATRAKEVLIVTSVTNNPMNTQILV